jgi:DNA-binding HxlR family transcriptional regulator
MDYAAGRSTDPERHFYANPLKQPIPMGSSALLRTRATTMKSKQANSGSVYDRCCPARLIIDHLADKWAVLIVGRLAAGTLRFAELRRGIDGISQKMLTSTLRDLERDGLVTRKLYASVPPKVEYTLTPLGGSLVNKVEELCRWAEANVDQVLKARKEFEERNR